MSERKGIREAWTRYVDGGEATRGNKYGAERAGNYASKHEAEAAVKFDALFRAGKIADLREQHRITLIPGDGKLRPVVYVADFTYTDENGFHVVDAKGYKTAIYRLKKRMAALLLGIQIEEV